MQPTAKAGSSASSNSEVAIKNAAAARPPARTRAQRVADGRARGEDVQGTPPSNTVPSKYIPEQKPVCRILRCAVDSLYLSYQGKLSNEMDDFLEDRKNSAKSDDDEEQSIAQITIADSLFQVELLGRRSFSLHHHR